MISSEEAYSSFLIFPLEFELASQLVLMKVHLLTFREPSVFTSKVEMQFTCDGMELWTSFTSPRWLNIEFLSYTSGELEDLPPTLIMVKTEGLGCLSTLNLRNTEDLCVLSFPILQNIEECCCDIDGCNLLNTDYF